MAAGTGNLPVSVCVECYPDASERERDRGVGENVTQQGSCHCVSLVAPLTETMSHSCVVQN